jgi:hypothetical protein
MSSYIPGKSHREVLEAYCKGCKPYLFRFLRSVNSDMDIDMIDDYTYDCQKVVDFVETNYSRFLASFVDGKLTEASKAVLRDGDFENEDVDAALVFNGYCWEWIYVFKAFSNMFDEPRDAGAKALDDADFEFKITLLEAYHNAKLVQETST